MTTFPGDQAAAAAVLLLRCNASLTRQGDNDEHNHYSYGWRTLTGGVVALFGRGYGAQSTAQGLKITRPEN